MIHRRIKLGLQLALVAGFALELYEGQWMNATLVLFILLVTFLPNLLARGLITGRTGTNADNKINHNTFLVYTNGDVADFELRFSYKITEKGNSGVQYRSKVASTGAFGPIVGGYQADFEGGKTYSGILYEERGRGILAQRGHSAGDFTARHKRQRGGKGVGVAPAALDVREIDGCRFDADQHLAGARLRHGHGFEIGRASCRERVSSPV